jgi:hypothetical protein
VNINAEFNLSLIWWQWTHNWMLFKESRPRVSSWAIVTYILVRDTLRLPVFSNSSLVAQIGVYLACRCVCMERKLFLHSQRQTSISDCAFTKPSPWQDSGHTNCSETTKA